MKKQLLTIGVFIAMISCTPVVDTTETPTEDSVVTTTVDSLLQDTTVMITPMEPVSLAPNSAVQPASFVMPKLVK